MKKKILILIDGKKKRLAPFKLIAPSLKIDLTTALFKDICFDSDNREIFLKDGQKISDFNIIYFRIVGKSLETASLVAKFAKHNGIKIVDEVYKKSQAFPITQSKAQEMKSLSDAKISIPKTFFGSLNEIVRKCPKLFGYPFVIKSTSGKKSKEVYCPGNYGELRELVKVLKMDEEKGKKYFAQKFIECTGRIRVLVVGNKIIGSIILPSKWSKQFIGQKPSRMGARIQEYIPDKDIQKLALSAVKSTEINIAGVDILTDSNNGRHYVIEVNAAPRWKQIKRKCRVNVEYEILKYLKKL